MRAAPHDGEADHLGDHTVPVVDHTQGLNGANGIHERILVKHHTLEWVERKPIHHHPPDSAWCDGLTPTAMVRRFEMEDREIRAALDRHWAASDANDFEGEHQIYREDAVLEYPQSGERIRGRRKIQSSRTAQPNRKRFTVRRIIGAGDLWVTEYVLTYDGRPSYTVSIMELLDGKVARETQYFGEPFEPRPTRAQWVERMD